MLTAATRNLFASLARSAQPVPPMEFILSLRKTYPQFGQTSRCVRAPGMGAAARAFWGWPASGAATFALSRPGHIAAQAPQQALCCCREGFYMQQDADECWGGILTSLKDKLKV
jgi:hypothetical protein